MLVHTISIRWKLFYGRCNSSNERPSCLGSLPMPVYITQPTGLPTVPFARPATNTRSHHSVSPSLCLRANRLFLLRLDFSIVKLASCKTATEAAGNIFFSRFNFYRKSSIVNFHQTIAQGDLLGAISNISIFSALCIIYCAKTHTHTHS